MIGLDGAERFVEIARSFSGCEVWQQDFLKLDLPAERFDGIFANASLFHVRDYVPDGMDGGVNIVPPAIDPLTPKNMALSPEDAAYIVDQFGIDVTRPLLTQVSRFDPWKDPLGVIDAYRLVKESGEWKVEFMEVGGDRPDGGDVAQLAGAAGGGVSCVVDGWSPDGFPIWRPGANGSLPASHSRGWPGAAVFGYGFVWR